MLHVLAQLAQYSSDYYTYGSDHTVSGGDAAAAGGLIAVFLGMGLLFFLFWAAIVVVMVISLWKLFVKAGKDGWISLVPFYNSWVMAEIAGREGWWGLIPVLNLIVFYDFVRSYGKDSTFAILSIFFGIITLPMMAFSKTVKYVGPAAKDSPVAPAGQ